MRNFWAFGIEILEFSDQDFESLWLRIGIFVSCIRMRNFGLFESSI